MRALVYACTAWHYAACRVVGRLWRGVYVSAAGPARLTDVTPPPVRPGWCLVRVRQCGLCASDLHLIRLHFGLASAPLAMAGSPAAPFILGHELVGVVEQSGASDLLPPGTRVISRSGGFRNCCNLEAEPCPSCRQGEYALCLRQGAPAPGHEPMRGGGFAPLYWEHAANLVPVPPALSDDPALLAEPLACALRAVLRLPALEAGQVLVIGAGLQGLGALYWLTRLYPQVQALVLARHRHQAELAHIFGAHRVVPDALTMERLAHYVGTTCLRGPGRNTMLLEGFDAVIDTIGTPQTVHRALRCIRPGGMLIVLGAHLFAGQLDYSPIWFRDVRVVGAFAHGMEAFQGRRVPTLPLVLELLAHEDSLPATLVTHRVPLEKITLAARLHDAKASSGVVRVAVLP
jgi:threonine dehydrogenase-like Zn-dependent dehydrogenase